MKYYREIFTQVKFFRQKAELKDSAMRVSSHILRQNNLLKKGLNLEKRVGVFNCLLLSFPYIEILASTTVLYKRSQTTNSCQLYLMLIQKQLMNCDPMVLNIDSQYLS